jgi:hypothetical protein
MSSIRTNDHYELFMVQQRQTELLKKSIIERTLENMKIISMPDRPGSCEAKLELAFLTMTAPSR